MDLFLLLITSSLCLRNLRGFEFPDLLWPLTFPSGAWSCSNVATTLSILGLNFMSIDRQCRARIAALCASSMVYWPSRRLSSTLKTFLLLAKYGLAHSTSLCSPGGRFLSTALLPESISSRTTPKLYTSLFAVRWPVN